MTPAMVMQEKTVIWRCCHVGRHLVREGSLKYDKPNGGSIPLAATKVFALEMTRSSSDDRPMQRS